MENFPFLPQCLLAQIWGATHDPSKRCNVSTVRAYTRESEETIFALLIVEYTCFRSSSLALMAQRDRLVECELRRDDSAGYTFTSRVAGILGWPWPDPPRTRSHRAGGAPHVHQGPPPTAANYPPRPAARPACARPLHRLRLRLPPPRRIITGGRHQGAPRVPAHDPFQRRDPLDQPRVRRGQPLDRLRRRSYIDAIRKHIANIITGVHAALTGDPGTHRSPHQPDAEPGQLTLPTSRTRYPSMPATRDVNVYPALSSRRNSHSTSLSRCAIRAKELLRKQEYSTISSANIVSSLSRVYARTVETLQRFDGPCAASIRMRGSLRQKKGYFHGVPILCGTRRMRHAPDLGRSVI